MRPVALLVLLLPAIAGAAERPSFNRRTGLFEPPFTELERAAQRGDRAELARWAARIGPARLGEALRGADRARVLAALDGAALLPGGVRLLDAVAPLAASQDAAIAERAARTLARMLDAAEPRRFEDWDVPADVVARACRALADAGRAPLPVTVRVSAVEALAEATACPGGPPAALLSDPAPEVRRAAWLAVRPRDELPGPLVGAALADADPGVTAAAAVAVCRRKLALGKAAPAPPRPLRDLAVADGTPVEDAVELCACLTPVDVKDRAALEQLRKRTAPALRDRAAEVLQAK